MDYLLACAAIFAIRLYQAFGRYLYRRECLFNPTCSNFAIQAFRDSGFRIGLKATRERLDECCSGYKVHFDEADNVILVTARGTEIQEQKVNPAIVKRMKQFLHITAMKSNRIQA